MLAHDSISAPRKLLAAFFSCALVVSLVPSVAFAAQTTGEAEVTESVQLASEVTPAAADANGFFDKSDSGSFRGRWIYTADDRTLTIKPYKENGSNACTLIGKPWRDEIKNGNFSETDVDAIVIEPGVFIENVIDGTGKVSDLRTFSAYKATGIDTPGFINVKTMDLSGLDTTKMVSMNGMFSGLRSLESLDLSKFDTTNVTDMSSMFSGCTKLKSVDLSSFATAKVAKMNSMFNGCEALNGLDLANFNTTGVDNMSAMFKGCHAIRSLSLASFDTSKVKNMNDMFDMCIALETLALNSTFTGINVLEAGNMFKGCAKLEALDLSSFDTPSITNLGHMFTGCSNLKVLNISRLATAKASNMDAMFGNCGKLEAVYVGKDFTFKGSEDDNEKPALLPEGTWVSTAEGTTAFSAEKLQEDPMSGSEGTIYLKTPVDIKYLAIKPLETDSYTYTGQQIEPKPSVTLPNSSHELEEGVDFTYVYTANVNVGTATVGIECSGDTFAGKSRTVTPFTIAPKSIAGANVQVPSIAYTGAAREPQPKVTDGDKVLVRDVDYTVEYANNVLPGTNATATIRGTGNYKDTKKASFEITGTVPNQNPSSQTTPGSQQADKQTVYRLYNPNSGEHFYTLSTAERDHLRKVGWTDEGVAWTAPKASKTPVHRLYNPNAGDHHYTTSAGERDALIKLGWNYENVSWYSDDAKTTTVYRAYNPNAVAGAHHYTMNKSEYETLVKLGWHGEGIGWYGASS